MSVIVLRILLVLLPIILFFVWRQYAQAKIKARETDDTEALDALQTRFMWVAFGLVAVFAVLAGTLAMTSGEDTSGVYVPPRMEDGQLVPGHFEERLLEER